MVNPKQKARLVRPRQTVEPVHRHQHPLHLHLVLLDPVLPLDPIPLQVRVQTPDPGLPLRPVVARERFIVAMILMPLICQRRNSKFLRRNLGHNAVT